MLCNCFQSFVTLPPGEAAHQTRAAQEPTRANETEERQAGRRPQESLEEPGRAVGCLGL
jgi:hypothetical protein